MQIGEIAERVGLSLRTVRYYEEVGLVTPLTRTAGGFRIYDDKAVDRLRLVRDLKPLGFALEEIREIVDLVTRGDAIPEERLVSHVERARAEHHKSLRSLEAAERIIELLDRLAAASAGSRTTTENIST